MIAVIDYGMGNLHSVRNALEQIGQDCTITADPVELHRADRLILPGVGAFPDAMRVLDQTGLSVLIREETLAGKPLLGICLGMQLLFEYSEEFTHTTGLGLIPGGVVPIHANGLKIPHIGWNRLSMNLPDDQLIQGTPDGTYVYFVHSFRADTVRENVVAYTEYGEEIPALVRNPSFPVWGAQFHPEKSHNAGLAMLKNFCKCGGAST